MWEAAAMMMLLNFHEQHGEFIFFLFDNSPCASAKDEHYAFPEVLVDKHLMASKSRCHKILLCDYF